MAKERVFPKKAIRVHGYSDSQPTMSSIVLLMTSFAKEAEATSAVRHLVEEHLAACGTLLPQAKSIYFWQDKMEESEEVVVFLKTAACCLEKCEKRLIELHPYEVPEIIVIEPKTVGEPYAAWVHEVLGINLRKV